MRAMWGIVACFAIAGLALLTLYFYTADKALHGKQNKDKSPAALTPGPSPSGGEGDRSDKKGPHTPYSDLHGNPMTTVYAGKAYDPLTLNPYPIQSVLTTRRRDAIYQALVRYKPQTALSADLPGFTEI